MSLPDIFKRKENQDDLEDMSYSRVGISLGGSWSWGVSMVATMAFMNTMGILPTLGWVIGNVLALPLFGFIKTKVTNFRKWLNFFPFLFVAAFIAFMAIVMNMQALLTGLGGGQDVASYEFLRPERSIPIIVALAFAALIYVYKFGLRGDVFSDVGYYILQISGVFLLAGASLVLNNFNINPELQLITSQGIEWIFPLGFLGIVSGVFTDPMMWQRFEQKKDSLKLSLLGSFWFGLYMFLVVITGLFFRPSFALGVLLLVVIFALALSTIESAIVALQFLTAKMGLGKTVGLILALGAVFTWPVLKDLGMSRIWGVYADYRWQVVTLMIISSLVGEYLLNGKQKSKIFHLLRKVKLYG